MLKNRRCGGPRMHAGNSMEGAGLQRKLTTILVADVAGDSRLMGHGEHPSNPTAVDFVMRGQAIVNRPASPQTMIAARSLAKFRAPRRFGAARSAMRAR